MRIKKVSLFLTFILTVANCGFAQNNRAVDAANRFLATLSVDQKAQANYPFESEERFNFHFFPKDNRKGISVNELDSVQQAAAMGLLQSCLSESAYKKARSIMQLEIILKSLENRKPEDNYRNPKKYYFTIFGIPSSQTTWGWRFEGHHISFNFTADHNQLISCTPGFLGTNPGIVPSGPSKGEQVLKEEADGGFNLLHSFSDQQLSSVMIDSTPNEIITFIDRKAMIKNPRGISYDQMTPVQQQIFLQLINLYVYRSTKLFADQQLKDIQKAGLGNLRFAWAGSQVPEIGKPHYYRIQGPTIIIEYDNSQNNANHVHSVVRDLSHDWGGDELLDHYKTSHQQ